MSPKELKVKNHQEIEGFDDASSVSYSTPTMMGCSTSFSATAKQEGATLDFELKTPLGNFKKAMHVGGDVSFSWKPFKYIDIDIAVRDFRTIGRERCFTVTIYKCYHIPGYGKICLPSYSYRVCHFVLEIPFRDFIRSQAPSDEQFAQALTFAHMFEKTQACDCK